MTPEQEARRNAIAWKYGCRRRMSMRELRDNELEIHMMADGSMILEVRDLAERHLPAHLEKVLPDGTVVEDSYVVRVG